MTSKLLLRSSASLCILIATVTATTATTTTVFAQRASQQREINRPAVRQVAVTFDDLPSGPVSNSDVATLRSMTERLLRSITVNKVPAIGFVNEGKLYVSQNSEPGSEPDAARVAVLRMWTDAGLELGNHTFAHAGLHSTPVAAYQEGIVRGEQITNMLLRERGTRAHYFRHPFLHTGLTLETKKTVEQFLAERGYRVAPVTIDNSDYVFAALYAAALGRGDRETMKRLGEAYIAYMEEVFAFFEKLSKDVVGYEVQQTLLLHANELNADYFDRLAAMMRKRGYSFITLRQALGDKAYALPDTYTNSKGISWLRRWAVTKGMKDQQEPGEPAFVTELYRALSNR